jgi:hypothetical protein
VVELLHQQASLSYWGGISFESSDEMVFHERKMLLEDILPEYVKSEAKWQAKRDRAVVEGIGKVLGVASVRMMS